MHKFRYLYAKVWLFPNVVQLDFERFNQVLICLGFTSLLIYGLAASLPRNKVLIRKSILEISLVLYSAILPFCEAAMYYLPLEESDLSSTEYNSLYSRRLMILTSIACIMIVVLLQNYHLVSGIVSTIGISISLSKIVALIIEVPSFVDYAVRHSLFIISFLKTSSVFVVNILFILLSCNLMKQGNQSASLKTGRLSTLKMYIFFIWPAVLLYSDPSFMSPLVLKLWGFEDYHSQHLIMIVKLAEFILLWGLSIFLVCQAISPDDSRFLCIKQISCMFFLLGLATAVFNVGKSTKAVIHINPYLCISNHSTTLNPSNGFWFTVAASLTVLHPIIFSSVLRLYQQTPQYITLLLCVGVSGFVTMQIDAEFEIVMLLIISNSLILYTHSIAAMNSNRENAVGFSKSVQATKKAHFVSFVALCVAAVSGSIVPVGSMFGICSFLLSSVIKMRKEKNTKTKSLGNLSSILSWVVALGISYKQYGLLSFGTGIECFFGIPVSEYGLLVCIGFLYIFLTEAFLDVCNDDVSGIVSVIDY
jgi:hypothetical protein